MSKKTHGLLHIVPKNEGTCNVCKKSVDERKIGLCLNCYEENFSKTRPKQIKMVQYKPKRKRIIAKVYIQGIEYEAECAVCEKKLTKYQVKKYEVNEMTYACSVKHHEELL